jgi:hypothetical protein
VVAQAFASADGLAMERQWWRELEDTYGIRRDDRSGWRQLPGDLKAAKRDPRQAKILDIPGFPGGVRGHSAQGRRAPELGVGVGARLPVRRQELRDGQVRAAQQPGRRIVPAYVGE